MILWVWVWLNNFCRCNWCTSGTKLNSILIQEINIYYISLFGSQILPKVNYLVLKKKQNGIYSIQELMLFIWIQNDMQLSRRETNYFRSSISHFTRMNEKAQKNNKWLRAIRYEWGRRALDPVKQTTQRTIWRLKTFLWKKNLSFVLFVNWELNHRMLPCWERLTGRNFLELLIRRL